MKIKITAILTAAVLLAVSICGCGKKSADNSSSEGPSLADTSGMDFSFTDRDMNAEYDAEKAVKIALDGSDGTVDGSGAAVKNGILTISSEGTYILSGSFNGKIKVAAGENDKVQLVFSGLKLSNSSGNALYISSADKVFITLADNTESSVSDGSSYTETDGSTTIDAAIFSRSDLTVNGSGALSVTGNYKHAIVSKYDLVITGGTLNISSQKVSLNGKDCVKIGGGKITLNAGSDGIRSDNSENSSRGYVYIAGGEINITAANDGIQAETVFRGEKGTVNIVSGGGSSAKVSSSDSSYKGIKAGSDIQITGGSYTVDSADDSVHSNNSIAISEGTFTLSSGDDGVHADNDLSVSGGKITVLKSYEGLEGSRVLISGGEINITASDDGINSAGGSDSQTPPGSFAADKFSGSSYEILISGGYTVVNASGDGLDSNGSLTVTGGVTLVSGPTSNGDGALDCDGTASVSGGVVIALGSNGMAQGFSQAENQGSILCSFSSQSAGTPFALCDSSGKAVVSFTPAKAYQSAAVTAPRIVKGGTYTVVSSGTVEGADENGYAQNAAITGGTTLASIEMTDLIYDSSAGMGGGMNGGMGGGQQPGSAPPDMSGENADNSGTRQEPPGGFGQNGGSGQNSDGQTPPLHT